MNEIREKKKQKKMKKRKQKSTHIKVNEACPWNHRKLLQTLTDTLRYPREILKARRIAYSSLRNILKLSKYLEKRKISRIIFIWCNIYSCIKTQVPKSCKSIYFSEPTVIFSRNFTWIAILHEFFLFQQYIACLKIPLTICLRLQLCSYRWFNLKLS